MKLALLLQESQIREGQWAQGCRPPLGAEGHQAVLTTKGDNADIHLAEFLVSHYGSPCV